MIKSKSLGQEASTWELMDGVEGLLQQKLSLPEGCRLRVQNMESWAQNIVNLVSPNYSTLAGDASVKHLLKLRLYRLSLPSMNRTVIF